MNRSRLHSALCKLVRLRVQKRLGEDVLIFQRNNGVGEVGGTRIAFGIAGAADLHGYVKARDGIARGYELEIKTGEGRLMPNQSKWRQACENVGVPYLLVHAQTENDLDTAAEQAAEFVSRIR
jgi:hypothetical protein